VALCSAGLAETLTLPADLMMVEAEAFMGDASLKTVVLPDGLQTIQTKAFAGSGVTDVNLPDTLTFIAEDAFDDTHIANLQVSEGTYAYTWAMEHDYLDWKWEDQPDGTVAITGYNGSQTEVNIPAQLNGKRVPPSVTPPLCAPDWSASPFLAPSTGSARRPSRPAETSNPSLWSRA